MSFAFLLWAMGKKNLLQWFLCMPSLAFMDIDHFVLTNVVGFNVKPLYDGQKILHVMHTIEFVVLFIVVLVLIFLLFDPPKGRSIKKWLFPEKFLYSKAYYYYATWVVRIFSIGIILHLFMDSMIYTSFGKWEYFYISLIQYFFNPT
jgi:hypothetical protein